MKDKNMLNIDNNKLEILFSSRQIQERIKEIASQINEDYKEKKPIILGVLNGAFIFMADLVKELSIGCEIDFIKLSSYGNSKISSGKVEVRELPNLKIDGRDIIIVEDIIDSGLSINFLKKIIGEKKPLSLKVASLLVKPKSLKYEIKIDYIGFEISDEFVVGYGLDYAQKYRNLPAIYSMINK